MEQGSKLVDHIPTAPLNSAKPTFDELETITNSIPGGVAQFARDENLPLLYASDGFYRICGCSREDLAGKTGVDLLHQIVPSEDVEYIYKSAEEQLQLGSEIQLEYRITKKGGGVAWVRMNAASSLNSHGVDVIQCIFVDITREKLMHQELQLEQERYRIITEQLNDVFFEYNFENDTIYTSSKWEELFGYPLPSEKFSSALYFGEIIYDDDKEALSQILERAREGTSSSELEIRLRKAGGGYIWTSVSTTIICGEDGNPVKAIGKIADIDERKREHEKLISSAQRDPLTRLYNKVAVESYIRSCLRATDVTIRHALMIIDVDNFKGVNDSLGHLFGDAVLAEISTKLRTLFRSTDILGRFGGDEFVVFLKNVGDNDKIAQKAKAVCDIFRETYTGGNRDYKISGSVGISVYPEHGKTFYELFKEADMALYEAKDRGKDGFVICGENGESRMEREHITSDDRLTHRSKQQIMKNSLAMDIYEMLCETKDVHGAIQFILRIIGREFYADRVYIYENEGGAFVNTYDWRTQKSESHKAVKPPYDNFLYALFDFKTEGFYYCPDVNELTNDKEIFRSLSTDGVTTLFQCPVFDRDDLKAVIGFEGGAPWSKTEQQVLMEISKIVGSFLMKYRLRKDLERERDLLRSMTESIDLRSYVIDPKTYRLLYLNSGMQRAAPDAAVGDFCYDALKKQETLCEDCPAAEMVRTASPICADLYDARRDSWFSVSATPIDWGGSTAALFCQTDVTRFVKAGSDAWRKK